MITISLNDAEVRGYLKDIMVKSKNMTPILKGVMASAMEDQKAHFKNAEGPDGKWPALSKWTRRVPKQKQWASSSLAKARNNKTPVKFGAKSNRMGVGKYVRLKPGTRMLGRLNSAFTARVFTDGNLVIRSRVKFSGVHQQGAKVGKGAKVPQRESLWFSQQFLEMVATRVGQFVIKRGKFKVGA